MLISQSLLPSLTELVSRDQTFRNAASRDQIFRDAASRDQTFRDAALSAASIL